MIIYQKKTQHPHVFANYKPLRNRLRETALIDTLYAISAYERYLVHSKPFPPDVRPHPSLRYRAVKWSIIAPWELEILVQEAIINCPDVPRASKSMRDTNHCAKIVNGLKTLENEISGINLDHHDIFFELFKLAHKEFSWQSFTADNIHLSRYHAIYSGEAISRLIETRYGLTAKELFFIGWLAYTHFSDNWRLEVPSLRISERMKSDMKKFLNRASLPYPILKECLERNRTMTPYYGHTFNPIRAHPIVQYGSASHSTYLCCSPTLLFWKITDGLYYDLVGMPGFDKAIGDAFQTFIGEYLKRIGCENKITVYPEMEYKKGRDLKRTCDWILEDADATVFVECKAKRIPLLAKNDIGSLEAEMDKTAAIIAQIYKTILDFKQGLYPQAKYAGKSIYPVIVTLQDWFLFTEAPEEILGEKIKERFSKEGLSMDLIQEIPYTICSSWDFEKAALIMKQKGINDLWKEKIQNAEKKKWLLGTYCEDKYSELLRAVTYDFFLDDLRASFESIIGIERSVGENPRG